MKIGERIKYLRKEILKLTQQDFSGSLNISRSNAGNIETCRVETTDRVIADICEKYNVNEVWLRTGEGEIFNSLTRNQIITDFADGLIKEDDTFKKRLIEALAELDENEWEMLERIAVKLATKVPAASHEPAEKDWDNMTVEEAEAEYIKSRSIHAPKKGLPASNTTAGEGDSHQAIG